MKLVVNNKDILPYILVGVLISLIILGFSPIGDLVESFWGFDLIGVFIFILFNFTVIHYWQKFPKPRGVENIKELPQTDDIRTPSFSYSGFVDRGINISYIKFLIGNDVIYLYYRNFFPIKIYYGPFFIRKIEDLKIGDFYLKEFKKINEYEANIKIGTKSGETNYTFLLRNLKDKDFILLVNNFKNLGYKLE